MKANYRLEYLVLRRKHMNSIQETPADLKTASAAQAAPSAPIFPPPNYLPRMQPALNQAYLGEDPRRKAPVLAMVLSLMPGLGQIYVGFYQQGFVNILVIASIIAFLSHGVPGYMEPLLGIFLAFYWLFNLVDAGRRASFYNQALSGMTETNLPADFMMYEGKGSLAGGVALVLLGLFFFAHTQFGMPLEWLDQWWPIGLVMAGLFLLYQNWQDRKKKE
jgi:hypothetical protein